METSTSTTPVVKIPRNLEPAHWFTTTLPRPVPIDLEHPQIYEYKFNLFPFSGDVYNPLVPVFSNIMKKGGANCRHKFIMFRDGALDLMRYFIKYPFPTLKPMIIVHEKHKSLIPASWKNHIYLYRTSNSKNTPIPVRKKLIAPLMLYSDICNEDEIIKSLDRLKNFVEGKDTKVYFYIKLFYLEFHIDDEFKSPHWIFNEISKRFPNAEYVAYNFFKKSSMKDFYFYEINDHLVFSYSKILDLCLGKQAYMLDLQNEEPPQDSEWFDISFQHGLHLHRNFEPDVNSSLNLHAIYQRIKEQCYANNSFPHLLQWYQHIKSLS